MTATAPGGKPPSEVAAGLALSVALARRLPVEFRGRAEAMCAQLSRLTDASDAESKHVWSEWATDREAVISRLMAASLPDA